MSYAQVHTLNVTTAADGSATVYTPVVTGSVSTIIYTKTDFDAGVDFTITTEETAQNVWVESDVNASKTVAPRQATHDTVGAASLYAAAGEPVEGRIYAVNERIKIVLASGGNVKTGQFVVIIA